MGVGVAVVGSAHVDYTVYLPRLPRRGETVIGDRLGVSPGGKGANQAVASSRLGAPTAFVSRVGSDSNGEMLLRVLRENMVDTRYVVVDDETPTGVAVIMVGEGGENIIAVYRGTDAKLTPGDVDRARDAFSDAEVVLAQLEVPLDAVEEAFRVGGEYGLVRVLNTAPYRPLPPGFEELVDVVIANEVEASQLLGVKVEGREDAERTAKALAERFGEAVVTLGSRGAVACRRGAGPVYVPAYRVRVVDTVAAGDAFAAAYAVGLAEGMELEERLRFSAAAAAVKVGRKGAITGLPRRSEVEALVRSVE